MEPLPPSFSRRTALAGVTAAVATAVAACTHDKKAAQTPTGSAAPVRTSAPGRSSSAAPSASATPDSALLAAAIAREIALIDAYDAGRRTAPTAAVLEDFGAHHAQHLARLRSLAGAESARKESASTAPSTSRPAPGTSSKPAAAAVRALFAALAVKEGTAADAGVQASATAGPTSFAVVLAEIAGNEAQHAALLPGFPIPASP